MVQVLQYFVGRLFHICEINTYSDFIKDLALHVDLNNPVVPMGEFALSPVVSEMMGGRKVCLNTYFIHIITPFRETLSLG